MKIANHYDKQLTPSESWDQDGFFEPGFGVSSNSDHRGRIFTTPWHSNQGEYLDRLICFLCFYALCMLNMLKMHGMLNMHNMLNMPFSQTSKQLYLQTVIHSDSHTSIQSDKMQPVSRPEAIQLEKIRKPGFPWV